MTKTKFQKKKEREREVRKKILYRREAKHVQERENAKMDAEEKAVRHKQRPIINEEFRAVQRMRDMEIRMQLERNVELLKGLQAEYEEELKKRETYINELKQQSEQSELIEEISSPEVASIFENACAGFAPAPSETLVEKATKHLEETVAPKLDKKNAKEEFQKFLQESKKKK